MLIGIDLRTTGRAAGVVRQMLAAVDLTLAQNQWGAGEARVDVVRGDAAALATDPRVLAVLGPFRSADTAAALPAINSSGIAALSASNTYVPLTSRGPSFDPDEPERFYSHGPRTYVRLFPNDFHQAAALAQVAVSLDIRRPFILHDTTPYGLALAEGFRRAASAAGLAVAGVGNWRAGGLQQVAVASADAVLLCGAVDDVAHQLIRDKVSRLGPNAGAVKLLAADGFLTGEPLDAAAAGMVVLAPGLRSPYFPEAAEQFVDGLSRRLEIEPKSVEPYAVHAAEAMALLLEAIGAADISRAALVQRLFDGSRHDGMLGAYTVLPSGDIAAAQDGPILGFSLYRASRAGVLVLERAIIPSQILVSAAFG